MKNLDAICKCAKYIVDYDTYCINDNRMFLRYDGRNIGCISIASHEAHSREFKRPIIGNAEIRVTKQFKTFVKLWGDVNAMPDIKRIMVVPSAGNWWHISTINDTLETVFIAWFYTNGLTFKKGRDKTKRYIDKCCINLK